MSMLHITRAMAEAIDSGADCHITISKGKIISFRQYGQIAPATIEDLNITSLQEGATDERSNS